MKTAWQRLIRFEDAQGRVLFGDPILPSPTFDLGKFKDGDKLHAKVIVGDDIYDTTGKTYVSDEVAEVKQIVGPLKATDVPYLRCIGLNYALHIKEAGRSPPPFPSMFSKPSTCVVGHLHPVVIPKVAQDEQADYEGELCLVIGKDTKDVTRDEALSYIAAYTCGNDISSRKLQRNPEFAGKLPQFNFSKGFDTFAALGPCLVSTSVIADPSKLDLKTTIDGEVRQDSPTADLLFDCAYIVSYLSSGTTLQKGSVIMTGTPGGVGAGMKPPKWLVPGTKMEVNISQIGTLENEVVYE